MSSGTIWCAEQTSMWMPPRSPIPSWSARTAAISTRSERGRRHRLGDHPCDPGGEDHIANTAPRFELFEHFTRPPAFGHHNLLVRADGALSKREQTLSIEAFPQGSSRCGMADYAATIGTSDPVVQLEPRRARRPFLIREAVARRQGCRRAGAPRPRRQAFARACL